MRKFFHRLYHWTHRRRMEADLAEELAFHQALRQQALEQAGMPDAEARLAARRDLGNITLAREASREVWISPWLESAWQDLRYALRNLLRRPGFTVLALGALGIAIGLNASLFTVFNAIAVRPWPVKDPARVVSIYSRIAKGPQAGSATGFALAEYRYFLEHARSFSGIIAMRRERVHFGFEDIGKTTNCFFVNGNYHRVLGVGMELGRSFLPDEDVIATPRSVVVLSDPLWRTRFGADPAIVGRQVRIDEMPFTVVGVATPDFTGTSPDPEELWIPLAALPQFHPHDAWAADLLRKPDFCCTPLAGRLAPGVSLLQARAELDTLSRNFHSQFGLDQQPVLLTRTAFLANPGAKRGIVPVFILMFVGVTLVLLLACANVGNLLLARAAARRREIAVRLSLGAGRRRIIRQLLTESLVLACMACGLGVALAWELPTFLMHRAIQEAFFLHLTPDTTVLAYALLLGVFACIAFGLAPALHATRSDVSSALKDQASLPRIRLSLRSLLLAVQVAVSVVLLIGAGLMLRAVRHARTQDPGFAVNDVTVASFDLPTHAYDDSRKNAFFTQLLSELRHIPECQSAGLSSQEPLSSSRMMTMFRLPGDAEEQRKIAIFELVSGGYFDVLRIPIVAGRNFETADAGRDVVLINEAMARRYWPGQNPVGKIMLTGGPGRIPSPHEIVGVVRDSYTTGLDQIDPIFYRPFAGAVTPKLIMRRTSAVSADRMAALVARLDPRVRVEIAPLADSLDRWLAPSRVGAFIAGMLGALALTLASIGMFGVFAYAVQQRTQEIGIRMALGAQPGRVVRLVLAGNSRAVLAGLLIGLAGAVVASRVLQRYLYGVSPFDPLAYGGVGVILASAALAATYLPARRATKIDPMTALRYE